MFTRSVTKKSIYKGFCLKIVENVVVIVTESPNGIVARDMLDDMWKKLFIFLLAYRLIKKVHNKFTAPFFRCALVDHVTYFHSSPSGDKVCVQFSAY